MFCTFHFEQKIKLRKWTSNSLKSYAQFNFKDLNEKSNWFHCMYSTNNYNVLVFNHNKKEVEMWKSFYQLITKLLDFTTTKRYNSELVVKLYMSNDLALILRWIWITVKRACILKGYRATYNMQSLQLFDNFWMYCAEYYSCLIRFFNTDFW